jgi:hypothetical protein
VDVFFSFLEGLLQAFTRTRISATRPQPTVPAASAET